MSDLESFLHNQAIQIPALIKIAIAHYQFETIHPFLDGNGRIGRLLIPLFLVDQKILEKPLLYISAFFEKDKSLYYDNLTRVRTKSDMTQWLKYFLVGILDTSENAIETLNRVLSLKSRLEEEMATTFGKRSQKANLLLQYLVNSFVEAGILKEMTGKNRNRLFIFEKYIQLF
jgi:Fic family protein